MGPVKKAGVNDALEGCVKRSGLNLPFTGVHSLRHSYAPHLLRQGISLKTMGLKTIGDLLGHRTAESTCMYLRLAFDLPLDEFAGEESFSARTLPIGLAVAAVVFSVIQLFLSRHTAPGQGLRESVAGFEWRPAVLLIVAMALYAWAFQFLGFALASFVFLFIGFLILGERRYVLSAIVAASLVAFLWVVLTQVFGLFVDVGDLYRALTGSGA